MDHHRIWLRAALVQHIIKTNRERILKSEQNFFFGLFPDCFFSRFGAMRSCRLLICLAVLKFTPRITDRETDYLTVWNGILARLLLMGNNI